LIARADGRALAQGERPMSLQFWLTTLVVVASPGIGVVYTLAAGLSRGARASLMAAFGCTLGIVPHVAAALLGLAAILHASALAFAALKYAGVAYLLFLAWCALRESGALRVERVEDRRSEVRIVVDAILANVLNPKLSIFFVAFLPQFVSSGEARPLLRMLELSAAFMAATFVVFALYGVFAASVRDHVIARPRVLAWLRRSFAAAFGALAVRLALTEE
jgi:threonine/homoserine/homoserine lactone efflux protein